MSSVRDLIRACISPFVQGDEVDALLDSMEAEGQRLEDFRVSVQDQMFLSTASKDWLRTRGGDIGFTEPDNLGLSDYVFRKLAIDTWNVKQVTSIIHEVLETFYGADAVRAYLQSKSEPFQLTDGMRLLIETDDKTVIYQVAESDYPVGSLAAAKATDVAAAMTKSFRAQGLNMLADEYIDAETGEKSVRIFSGSLGPTGYVKISGGDMEIPLAFDTLIENVMAPETVGTWTNWQVTRIGNNVRYTWGGNQDPGLSTLKSGDIALIYGDNFNDVGAAGTDLRGSWEIVEVNPDVMGSGYFEVFCPTPVIGSSETISINQGVYNALRFMRPKTMRPNFRKRYALAWEPTKELLKIYLPATTRVIERGLIGAAHMKYGISTKDLEGSFGSNSVDSARISVVNDYSLSWDNPGYDNWAFGGKISFENWSSATTYFLGQIVTYSGLQYKSLQNSNLNNTPDMSPSWWIEVDTSLSYIKREIGITTAVMNIPHGIRSLASSNVAAFNSSNSYVIGDIVEFSGFLYISIQDNPATSQPPTDLDFWAQYSDDSEKSNAQIVVSDIPEIADESPAPAGSYVYDTDAGYTLTSQAATLGAIIQAGESYRDVSVTGMPSPTFPDAQGYVILDLNRDTQEVAPIIGATSNSVIFDPSYVFKYSHASGADVTYLSSNRYVSSPNGSDRGFYVTGTYEARKYCQDILNKIIALGIKLEIVILYPNDIGLGGAGNDTRDEYQNTESNPQSQVVDEFHSDVVWVYGPY